MLSGVIRSYPTIDYEHTIIVERGWIRDNFAEDVCNFVVLGIDSY
jgi:hypothetical protein